MKATATIGFDVDVQAGMRWSGHETFACRYAWLPKAVKGLRSDPALFVDEDEAMVALGLGKNMVRALKFWVEATGVAQTVGRSRTMALTDFGEEIFGQDGHDPYLEDPRTLWLLHWKLASQDKAPLFAWRYLISHWPYPEFTHSQALRAFQAESRRRGLEHSDVTLNQHLDVFLHTYHRARGSAVGVEDSLDGPLVELQLLAVQGERQAEGRRWETVYAFRREAKPQIGSALFDYCLMDYWTRFAPQDRVLPFRMVAAGAASPGQVFKLPEDDVRARLDASARRENGPFTFQASAVEALLIRAEDGRGPSLAEVYAGTPTP